MSYEEKEELLEELRKDERIPKALKHRGQISASVDRDAILRSGLYIYRRDDLTPSQAIKWMLEQLEEKLQQDGTLDDTG